MHLEDLNPDDQYDDDFQSENHFEGQSLNDDRIVEAKNEESAIEEEILSPRADMLRHMSMSQAEGERQPSMDAEQWREMLGTQKEESKIEHTPEEIEAQEEDVVCNEVYVWGDDSRGQLGLSGIFGDEVFFGQPQICSFNVVIKQLACGLYHTIFGAENGLLYSMGCNKYGQLGIGDKESLSQSSPTLIANLMPSQENPQMIVQIACGLNHSLALSEGGEAYSWG